jgi:hypothetical protein
MPADAPQWEQAISGSLGRGTALPQLGCAVPCLIERLNHCAEIDSENSCDAAGHRD